MGIECIKKLIVHGDVGAKWTTGDSIVRCNTKNYKVLFKERWSVTLRGNEIDIRDGVVKYRNRSILTGGTLSRDRMTR